jgi:ribosomal protein S18 acetylase RimI-like enzyme
MSDIVIERPSMGAVEELAELWVTLAIGQREHGSHLYGPANRDRITESISRHVAMSELHVARADDAIVGFVMYTIEGTTFEQSATRGLVQNIFVDPAYRREGVGSRLLSAAEDALEADGADVVGLEVMADNDDARAFYRDHGYDPHRVTLEKPIENDTS